MTTSSDDIKEGELIESPLTLNHRRDQCSLDDAYLFNFTNNPRAGKTAALRAAGFEGKFAKQEAYRMHNRLRPKIRQIMQEINQDLAAMSNQQLMGILSSEPKETGYQAMLGAIKLGFEYAGTTPQEVKTIKPQASQIQQRITTLLEQIEQATGQKKLPSTE